MPSTDITPAYRLTRFTCPHCHELTKHEWSHMPAGRFNSIVFTDLHLSQCLSETCGEFCLWIDRELVHPE